MRSEKKATLSSKAFADQLKALEISRVIPPGRCKQGCGRKIAAGLDPKGRPWQSCCRGCVMGFGHDQNCGQTGALLVEGICINPGCGRPHCPGKHPSGRAYSTCCRSCSSGVHDAWCGNSEMMEDNMANQITELPGMCKMGCGRKVAESKPGCPPMKTCCKGCACNLGYHSKACKG